MNQQTLGNFQLQKQLHQNVDYVCISIFRKEISKDCLNKMVDTEMKIKSLVRRCDLKKKIWNNYFWVIGCYLKTLNAQKIAFKCCVYFYYLSKIAAFENKLYKTNKNWIKSCFITITALPFIDFLNNFLDGFTKYKQGRNWPCVYVSLYYM